MVIVRQEQGEREGARGGQGSVNSGGRGEQEHVNTEVADLASLLELKVGLINT